MRLKSLQISGRSNAASLLGLLLLLSVGVNAAYFFRVSGHQCRQVLATVGEQKFTLDGLDDSGMAVLRAQSENWAQGLVLPKEAASRSVSVDQLLKTETTDKIKLSQEEIYRQYVLSPSADALPWPQVLKEIESDLRSVRAEELRREFVKTLYPKYGVVFNIPGSPAASVAPVSRRFAVFTPPPAGSEISGEGMVIHPPSIGPAEAPVVLEVYSDFMCPFSHRFFTSLNQWRTQYPEKLRLVFRQFPLPMHGGAHLISEASACAQEQGKFWEYHDRLMGGDTAKKEKPALIQLAQDLGLDVPKFQGCVDSGKYVSWVDAEIESGKSRGASGTPTYFINGRKGVGVLSSEAFKPLMNWSLKPEGRYPVVVAPKPASGSGCGATGLDPNRVYTFPEEWLKAGPSTGPAKATSVIVEFLDYNCPFCRQGSQTVSELLKKHPEVRVIAKNFPLPMHPNAFKTAEAVMCADQQGKFWEYRKEIFGDSWGKQSPNDLKAAAKKIGLKENKFNTCLDKESTKDRVTKDMEIGKNLGVQGTPAYFVNGKALSGSQSLDKFEAALTPKK